MTEKADCSILAVFDYNALPKQSEPFYRHESREWLYVKLVECRQVVRRKHDEELTKIRIGSQHAWDTLQRLSYVYWADIQSFCGLEFEPELGDVIVIESDVPRVWLRLINVPTT